jgi:DNA invertase Pin-like site-specific DNA recombinase
MGRLIGYARVSTADQDLQRQIEALQHAGCHDDQIFRDIASGARTARPGLEACLQALAPGDTLVVWCLDRLGRSMVHLVTVIDELLRLNASVPCALSHSPLAGAFLKDPLGDRYGGKHVRPTGIEG